MLSQNQIENVLSSLMNRELNFEQFQTEMIKMGIDTYYHLNLFEQYTYKKHMNHLKEHAERMKNISEGK